MKKSKKDINEIKKIKNVEELEEIEDANPTDIIKEKLSEHNFFFVHFIKRLKTDKFYLFSFIITLIFLCIVGTVKVKQSDGVLYKKDNKTPEVTNSNDTTLTPADETKKEVVDVTDYVGTYSKEFILDNVINFGENCSVDTYKYIYQIQADGKITKYFYNSCIGTIKIWEDTFKYNNANGARYIGTSNMNFTFSTNKIKEVDGSTFKIDKEISTIKESKNIDEIDISFYGNSTVIMTNTNLLVINNDKVSSPIGEEYNNNGGNLTQRFYKSSNEYQYNFIVFNKTVEDVCDASNTDDENELVYTTYSIRFDSGSDNFLEPKKVVSRTKSDSCKNYKKDIANLKE